MIKSIKIQKGMLRVTGIEYKNKEGCRVYCPYCERNHMVSYVYLLYLFRFKRDLNQKILAPLWFCCSSTLLGPNLLLTEIKI